MNKELQLIEKLSVFIENISYDIELDALLEDSSDDSDNKESEKKKISKKNTFCKLVKKIFSTIWHFIKVTFKHAYEFITRKRYYFKIHKDLSVTKFIFEKIPNIPDYKNSENTECFNYLIKITDESNVKHLKKNETIDIRKVNSSLNSFVNIITKFDKSIDRIEKSDSVDPSEIKYYTTISNIFKKYYVNANTLLNEAIIDYQENERSHAPVGRHSLKVMKYAETDEGKKLRLYGFAKSYFDESSNTMTNKELRAHLLIEAANILEEIDESAGRNSAYDRWSNALDINTSKVLMNNAMDEHDLDKAIKYKKECDEYVNADPKKYNRRINKYNPNDSNQHLAQSLKSDADNNKKWVNEYNLKNSIKANPIHAKINAKAAAANNESVADLLMEAAYMLTNDNEYYED